jgi:hypothetical protein
MQIDESNVFGRIFYAPKDETQYIVRGLIGNKDAITVIGEYTEPDSLRTRMKTFDLSCCSFSTAWQPPKPAPDGGYLAPK